MPIINILGQKFGKLTVIERDLSRQKGAAYWICQCECGNRISTRGSALRNGTKKDCGCVAKLKRKQNIDISSIVDNKYGRLTVIERDLSKPIGHQQDSYWICLCDCGNKISVRKTDLLNGHTQSCGCLHKELLSQRNIKNIQNQRFGKLVAKENTYKKNNHNSYIWRCECDCGNINYLVSTEALLSGRVNSCGCNKVSLGETKIYNLLLTSQIPFAKEYSFSNLKSSRQGILRYDFALFNEDNQIIRLIEFDGSQHFQPSSLYGGETEFLIRQENDQLKNAYAKQHNIPLVRIPYTALNEITLESLLGDKFLIV